MSVITVTKDNFNEIKASDKPVLLDFYADWCGPCRMLSPLVDEVAEEHPEIAVGKVNVDQNPALCAAFGISSIPFLAFLRGGKLVASSLGYCAKEEIEALLSK
jgi:thioredoxin 1